MNSRQGNLLKSVISQYIKTAMPVGSNLLAADFKLSSATIRNEMAELEKGGYIYQPHTSAGRVPTEKGYKFYIENILGYNKAHNKIEEQLLKFKNANKREDLKSLAKFVSRTINEAVIIAFNKNDIYYTGISFLFSKPEFSNLDLITNVSQVIDHIDEKLCQAHDDIRDLYLKIGSENPFGQDCAVIMTKTKKGIFGIIGPLRMNYEGNISIIKSIKDLF